jgi:hypothetical protein
MGEQPSAMTLAGASIVLSAVVANELFAAYTGRRALVPPP